MKSGPRNHTIEDVLLDLVICEPDSLETGCWEWPKSLNKGYGQKNVCGKMWIIHREVYRHFKGEIPEGLDLDHLCRNRKCANPDHLEPVTRKENLNRSPEMAWGRANREKTHRLKGHLYDGENLRLTKDGKRQCRTCDRIRYLNNSSPKHRYLNTAAAHLV